MNAILYGNTQRNLASQPARCNFPPRMRPTPLPEAPFVPEEFPDFLTSLYSLRSAVASARRQALHQQATERRGLTAAADLAGVEEPLSAMIRTEDEFQTPSRTKHVRES